MTSQARMEPVGMAAKETLKNDAFPTSRKTNLISWVSEELLSMSKSPDPTDGMQEEAEGDLAKDSLSLSLCIRSCSGKVGWRHRPLSKSPVLRLRVASVPLVSNWGACGQDWNPLTPLNWGHSQVLPQAAMRHFCIFGTVSHAHVLGSRMHI